MKIKDIVEGSLSETEVTSLEIDSRKCRDGSLYFAIPGTRVDGHKFVSDAYKNGARAAIVEYMTDCAIEQIVVKNTRIAMAHIAAAFYGFPQERLKLIGVTGTNGKTSISYMVRAIANANGISCGVIGTGGIWLDNKRLDISFLTATTPDPIELQYTLKKLADMGAKWVCMEVTAHALDLHKTDGMRFASAGFTNLTQDHLDYFGTMENYGNAKKRLFTAENAEGCVINCDDEFGRSILSECEMPCITYSVGGEATLAATEVSLENAHSTFVLRYKGRAIPVKTNTTGLFNISNALCAIGCCIQAGLCVNSCVRGIEAFGSVPGRFEAVDTGDRDFGVIIDYAHTPDGLENVLKAINSFKRGRVICVFGCGGNRDAAKRPIMGEIAGRFADYCVLTSDNPRFEEPETIIDAIEAGIKKTECPYIRDWDRAEAIRAAMKLAEKGDTVVICGKGDEDYQEIKGVKHDFSDRETVKRILDEM